MASNRLSTFPTFRHEDIINFCVDYAGTDDIPVKLSALKTPTKASTIAIFEFFFRDLMGLSIDQVSVMPFQLLDSVQHPEAYPEIRLHRFYGMIKTFMTRIHYDDFCTDDLTQPTVSRLRRQLSAFINFMLHVQEIQAQYTDRIAEDRRHARDHSARLVQEVRDLKAGIQCEMEREEPLHADLQTIEVSVSSLSGDISLFQQQKEQQQTEARRLKADVGAFESQLQTIAVREAKLNEENKALETQLVGSPDRFRERVTAAKKELEASEGQLECTLERRQGLHQMRTGVEEKVELIDKLKTKMTVLQELHDKQAETTSRMKDVTAGMSTVHQDMEEAHSSNRQLQKKCEMIEESRETQLLKNSQYLEEKRAELEKRKAVLQHSEEQSTESQQRARELEQDLQEVEEQLKQLQEQHRQRMDAQQAHEQAIRDGAAATVAQFNRDIQTLRQQRSKLRKRLIENNASTK